MDPIPPTSKMTNCVYFIFIEWLSSQKMYFTCINFKDISISLKPSNILHYQMRVYCGYCDILTIKINMRLQKIALCQPANSHCNIKSMIVECGCQQFVFLPLLKASGGILDDNEAKSGVVSSCLSSHTSPSIKGGLILGKE